MSHYEITFILSASIAETEYPTLQQEVVSDIQKIGGTISKEVVLGRRKLSYPINKEKHGYYVTFEFDAEPGRVIELDKGLKLNNSILRHLIITKKVLTPEQEEARAARKAKAQLKQQQDKEAEKRSKPSTKKESAPKISLEKLDEKLDELLEQEIK